MVAQNNEQTAVARRGRPWQKGQSGNPGGRPKRVAEVESAARAHTAEAIERLVHWMRSDDPTASIRAATAILERGWGKPAQAVNIGSGLQGSELIVFSVDPVEREGRPASEELAREALPAVQTSEQFAISP